jgi:hypothetical protein
MGVMEWGNGFVTSVPLPLLSLYPDYSPCIPLPLYPVTPYPKRITLNE